MNLPPLLNRGSVKNIRGGLSEGEILFEFTDRYSIFDWGEMPDQLNGKGLSLAVMGKVFFAYLEKADNWKNLFKEECLTKFFSKEFLGRLEDSASFQNFKTSGLHHHARLDELQSNTLKVKKVSILRPGVYATGYNYNNYQNRPVNTLVPLEIIFRFALPPGNSYSKRHGTPASLDLLQNPLVDFSTKLERGDRYLSFEEAKTISWMNETEWQNLQDATLLIGLNLFVIHQKMGLTLLDGKIEMAFGEEVDGNRTLMLVDSIGLDELRLQYKGKSFSKEFLRETYKDSKWYADLETAKNESKKTGEDFKELCLKKFASTPSPLKPQVKERAEAVYKSYCNSLCSALKTPLVFSGDFNLENYSKRFL